MIFSGTRLSFICKAMALWSVLFLISYINEFDLNNNSGGSILPVPFILHGHFAFFLLKSRFSSVMLKILTGRQCGSIVTN